MWNVLTQLSTQFFKLPQLTVPWLLQMEGSLKDVSSKTLDVRHRAVDEAHNLLTYVTIRPGVAAEAGAGNNEAGRRSVQDARGRNILML